ncbi:putative Late nodulin [Medicago truncatula]|uniref:Putative Late nodulin n=1 Tax=Medicago truncatula TaxID=3880 RepID=A0A396GUQ1_MEDTR|nr:putative Late nodulin [Medicago truncatula]
MTETLKFVYVLILFISIFLVIIVCESSFFPSSPVCKTDKDCPQLRGYTARCRKTQCLLIPRG